MTADIESTLGTAVEATDCEIEATDTGGRCEDNRVRDGLGEINRHSIIEIGFSPADSGSWQLNFTKVDIESVCDILPLDFLRVKGRGESVLVIVCVKNPIYIREILLQVIRKWMNYLQVGNALICWRAVVVVGNHNELVRLILIDPTPLCYSTVESLLGDELKLHGLATLNIFCAAFKALHIDQRLAVSRQ